MTDSETQRHIARVHRLLAGVLALGMAGLAVMDITSGRWLMAGALGCNAGAVLLMPTFSRGNRRTMYVYVVLLAMAGVLMLTHMLRHART